MSHDVVREVKRRLAQEQGAIVKDWGGRVPIALVYPNSYHVGMSNLGFQTIYGFINSDDRFVCERVFWETPKSRQPGQTPLPPLSLESLRPLADFAVVAFSISYEQDYVNVVNLLRSAGLPLLSQDRDDRHPLVIAGGPISVTNPEPVAPFLDAIAIGEGEVILPDVLEAIHSGIGGSRAQVLHTLCHTPGVYVPALTDKPVQRQYVFNLDDYDTQSTVITPETELSSMHLIEVARGCGWGCRFCVAGYLFRPMRPRSVERIIEQARNGMQRTDKVGLLGAAAGDYPELDELVTRLHAMGTRLSVSSLRVNNLTDALLRSLDRSGARNVTVAPEAGSERLRKFVNKSLTEQDILDSFHKIGRYGIRQYKHYYIVGLPTETDEEAMEIARITLEGRKVIDSYKSGAHIVLDISPFVPKAGTAFQWLPMTPLEVTERRLVAIKRALRGKNIEVKWDSPEWSAVDTVLSRGGRELAPVLMRLNAHLTVSSFRRTMAECGLDMDKYVFSSYPVDKPLPWDTVDTGVKKGFFKLELANAYKHKEFGVCPPAGCRACGVC